MKNGREIKDNQDIINLLMSKEEDLSGDKAGKVSKYNAVQESILKDIKSGKYMPNDKLPSENEFCKIYNTSRVTVRRALDELMLNNVLYKVQGVGTFVKEPIESAAVNGKVLVILPFAISSAMEIMVPEISKGMSSVFDQKGISYFEILEPGSEEGIPRFMKTLKEMKPLSIAYLSYFSWDLQPGLRDLNCPIVYIDTEPDDNMFDVVVGEDYLSAYRATQMLLNHGHKNIGFYSQWSKRYSASRERMRGVMDAVQDNGGNFKSGFFSSQEENKSHITHGDIFRYNMIEAIRKYLEANTELTALVTMNDAAATAALLAADEMGLSIPNDLKIISYGNYYNNAKKPSHTNLRCSITSYDQHFEEYGRRAAEMLYMRMSGELPMMQQKRTIKYDLIRKQSF